MRPASRFSSIAPHVPPMQGTGVSNQNSSRNTAGASSSRSKLTNQPVRSTQIETSLREAMSPPSSISISTVSASDAKETITKLQHDELKEFNKLKEPKEKLRNRDLLFHSKLCKEVYARKVSYFESNNSISYNTNELYELEEMIAEHEEKGRDMPLQIACENGEAMGISAIRLNSSKNAKAPVSIMHSVARNQNPEVRKSFLEVALAEYRKEFGADQATMRFDGVIETLDIKGYLAAGARHTDVDGVFSYPA